MSAGDAVGPSAPQTSSHQIDPATENGGPQSRELTKEAGVVARYSGLYAPVDRVYVQIARMAARVFEASIVTVAVADDATVWFPADEGPEDGGPLPAGPSMTSRLNMPPIVSVVLDAAGDPRTQDHPWVRADDGVRFFVTAPIVITGDQVVGHLEVMDRKRRRRVGDAEIAMLEDLAATIAQLLNVRVGALADLKMAEDGYIAEIARRDSVDRAKARLEREGTITRDQPKPEWCQLGGARTCDRPAETKVADSWGDSAWGCWQHAEEALVQIPSVFLALPSDSGLAAYRDRTTYPDSPA